MLHKYVMLNVFIEDYMMLLISTKGVLAEDVALMSSSVPMTSAFLSHSAQSAVMDLMIVLMEAMSASVVCSYVYSSDL